MLHSVQHPKNTSRKLWLHWGTFVLTYIKTKSQATKLALSFILYQLTYIHRIHSVKVCCIKYCYVWKQRTKRWCQVTSPHLSVAGKKSLWNNGSNQAAHSHFTSILQGFSWGRIKISIQIYALVTGFHSWTTFQMIFKHFPTIQISNTTTYPVLDRRVKNN